MEGIKGTGLTLVHGGPVARYSLHVDAIHVPQKADFHSTEDYYSTLLHECAHATAAPHRLNRDLGKPNSAERAREELRAEIASAMLCAETGIPMGQHHVQSHAAYVLSWVASLKNDVNAIFEAAAAAEGICDYLNSHALKLEPNRVQNEESNRAFSTPSPAPNFRAAPRL